MTQLIAAVLDIETTGLKQEDGHRIIEIAAALILLEFDPAGQLVSWKKVGQTWTQRINPMRSIDAGAQQVHGITAADLKDSPEWEFVAPKVKKILEASDLAVAHNAMFDMPFIGLELIRIEETLPPVEVFCTMTEGRTSTSMGKVPNLEELCWAVGVRYNPDEAHAADYDVDRTVECLIKGLEFGYFDLSGVLEKKLEQAA